MNEQTVEEWATATLSHRTLKQTSVRSYLRSIRDLGIADIPIGSLTLGLLHQRLLTYHNNNTRRKHCIAVKSVFRDLLPDLKMLPTPTPTSRRYNLPDEPTLRFGLMFSQYELQGLLMAYAGARLGEAVATTADDLKGNVLNIYRQVDELGELTASKTCGPVVIPWWLADRIKTASPCEASPPAVAMSIVRSSVKAGYRLNPHQLRHWFCTRMIDNGVHPEVCRRQMRHKRLSTTLGVYAQFTDESMGAMVEDLFGGNSV